MQQDEAVHLWPSDEQKLLLDAALQDGSGAVSARIRSTVARAASRTNIMSTVCRPSPNTWIGRLRNA